MSRVLHSDFCGVDVVLAMVSRKHGGVTHCEVIAVAQPAVQVWGARG